MPDPTRLLQSPAFPLPTDPPAPNPPAALSLTPEPIGPPNPFLDPDIQNVLLSPVDPSDPPTPLLESDEEESNPSSADSEPQTNRNTNPHFWETSIPSGTSATLSPFQQLTEFTALHREGPVHFRLQLNNAWVADDNITLDRQNKKKDILVSLGPSASFSLGSDETPFRLALSYAGAAVAFLQHSEQKSYDQIGTLAGSWNGQKLRVTFRAGGQHTRTSANDPGDRVGRRIFYGGVNMTYAVGEKLSTEWSADATQSTFDALLRSKEFRSQTFLQYQWTPKIRMGIGNTGGLLIPERGQRQTYVQGLFRALYAPTAKITLDAQAGADVRRFRNGRNQTSTPVFSAAANWAVTPKTQVSVEGRRRIFSSAALESQNYTVTGLSTGIQHLLSDSLSAGITTGYEHAQYSATRLGIEADRRDDYGFIRIHLNWAVHRRVSLGGFYELSRNFSTGIQNREFTRNRIGFSGNLQF